MRETAVPPSRVDWLIDEFADRVPGVAHAVVVSSDGLLLARTRHLPPDRAAQLAAMTSGLVSLAVGGAEVLGGGPVAHAVVEMDRGTMIVMMISDGSSLAVLAAPGSEIGLVGFEMTLLVDRAGRVLTPELRRELTVADGGGA